MRRPGGPPRFSVDELDALSKPARLPGRRAKDPIPGFPFGPIELRQDAQRPHERRARERDVGRESRNGQDDEAGAGDRGGQARREADRLPRGLRAVRRDQDSHGPAAHSGTGAYHRDGEPGYVHEPVRDAAEHPAGKLLRAAAADDDDIRALAAGDSGDRLGDRFELDRSGVRRTDASPYPLRVAAASLQDSLGPGALSFLDRRLQPAGTRRSKPLPRGDSSDRDHCQIAPAAFRCQRGGKTNRRAGRFGPVRRDQDLHRVNPRKAYVTAGVLERSVRIRINRRAERRLRRYPRGVRVATGSRDISKAPG